MIIKSTCIVLFLYHCIIVNLVSRTFELESQSLALNDQQH